MLLADGAMGTELLRRSPGLDRPSSLNLLNPELVLALHREYVEAGARLLVTNTLGATAGVRLARSVPLPSQGERLGEGTSSERLIIAGSLAAQPSPTPALIEALAEADVVLLETVTSLAALEAAVAAIRQLSPKPLWATLSFDCEGRLEGLTPSEIVRKLPPIDAYGYGCGFGPDAAHPVLQELRAAAPQATLIAKPNLGLPPYDVSPAQLASWAEDMARLGVDVIGACCGSTPAHIRAVAGRLDSYG